MARMERDRMMNPNASCEAETPSPLTTSPLMGRNMSMECTKARLTAVQMLEAAMKQKHQELEELNRLHKLAKIAELNPELEATLFKLLDVGLRRFR